MSYKGHKMSTSKRSKFLKIKIIEMKSQFKVSKVGSRSARSVKSQKGQSMVSKVSPRSTQSLFRSFQVNPGN